MVHYGPAMTTLHDDENILSEQECNLDIFQNPFGIGILYYNESVVLPNHVEHTKIAKDFKTNKTYSCSLKS